MPSTPPFFFTCFLLRPLSSSLSTTASLSFRGPRAPFAHLEQDITHTRDCCLVPRHTFILLLKMHLKYSSSFAVFRSRRSSYPSTYMLCCTVSLLVLAVCARIFPISHKRMCVSTASFYLTLWIFYFWKFQSCTFLFLPLGPCTHSRGACYTLITLALGDCCHEYQLYSMQIFRILLGSGK